AALLVAHLAQRLQLGTGAQGSYYSMLQEIDATGSRRQRDRRVRRAYADDAMGARRDFPPIVGAAERRDLLAVIYGQAAGFPGIHRGAHDIDDGFARHRIELP